MADAMQVGFRTVDGVQVRCADSTGPSAPSILLTALSGPSLLSSMVMGSGGAAVPILLSGPLAEWVLAPDLVGFRAIDPQAIVGTPLETIEGYRPPPEVREDYPESYAGDRLVESMSYAPTRTSFPAGRASTERQARRRGWAFGWEQRADEYASLIAGWVADGYRAAAGRGPTAAVMSPATDGGNDELEQ